MAERKWRVRLGAAAEVDFANILKWTTESFGARQSRIYRDTLLGAIGELANGPDVVGSKARSEIMSGLRTIHVARRAAGAGANSDTEHKPFVRVFQQYRVGS